jgi:Raf kinase inhibitor-like YbhB/YbcL family protein
MKHFILPVSLALFMIACISAPALTEIVPTVSQPEPTPAQPLSTPTLEVAMSFTLMSTAFGNGQPIPTTYSCKGRDVSPPLTWNEPPAGTQSLALILDDPDAPAGTWVHWVIFNLPATARGLAEATPKDAPLTAGGINGVNSWGRSGYGGPCPPSGTHRYFFKLYALDTLLALTASADKSQVLTAMEGHILAQSELMGTYSK